MPRRMSVCPTASHTRTPDGTGITAAPMPQRRRPPKPATLQPGSTREHGPPIRSRSQPSAAGQCHRQTEPSAPEQNHWQLLANPAANDKSSSVSRQPDAPRPVPLRRAQTPPRQSPASARCSTDAAARDRPVPRRSPLHPSLAPVQTPVFALVLTSPIKSQIASRSSADGYHIPPKSADDVQKGIPRSWDFSDKFSEIVCGIEVGSDAAIPLILNGFPLFARSSGKSHRATSRRARYSSRYGAR